MFEQQSWKRPFGMSRCCSITVNGLYNIIQNSTKLYFQSKLLQTVNFVTIFVIFWKNLLISNLPYLLASLIYLFFSLYLPLDFLPLYFLINSTSLSLLCQPIKPGAYLYWHLVKQDVQIYKKSQKLLTNGIYGFSGWTWSSQNSWFWGFRVFFVFVHN